MFGRKSSIFVLVLMLLLALLIFIGDIFFPNASLAAFYVSIVLMSLWADDRITIAATITTIVLVLTAYYTTYNKFDADIIISKFLSIIMIIGGSFFVVQRREVETKVKRLAETIELRVLARTAAAEARSKRLENQIKTLQIIRQNNTDHAFTVLDEVIQNLKDLHVDKDN